MEKPSYAHEISSYNVLTLAVDADLRPEKI